MKTPKRKSFVRKISRSGDTAKSVARAALSDPDVMKYLAAGFGKQIKFEIKRLCTARVNSIQKSSDRRHVIQFPWVTIIEEAKEHCPSLLTLLYASTKTEMLRFGCMPVCVISFYLCYRPNHLQFLCAVICLLSKFHNDHMSLFQKLISAILFEGHCGTMVSLFHG